MKIAITQGSGCGRTDISAFHSALSCAGIGGYNLLFLSSILPPGSQVSTGKFEAPPDDFGRRMYVVLSRGYARRQGEQVWTGLGCRWESSSGRGVIAEASALTRKKLVSNLGAALDDMYVAELDTHWEQVLQTQPAECSGDVACAVVAAVFGIEPW
ncbi:pyruvoyl-dependent arginine decarboxylase [Candidatus Bipolaricaulota bacterium]